MPTTMRMMANVRFMPPAAPAGFSVDDVVSVEVVAAGADSVVAVAAVVAVVAVVGTADGGCAAVEVVAAAAVSVVSVVIVAGVGVGAGTGAGFATGTGGGMGVATIGAFSSSCRLCTVGLGAACAIFAGGFGV